MRYFKQSKLKLLLKRIQQNFIACDLTRKEKFLSFTRCFQLVLPLLLSSFKTRFFSISSLCYKLTELYWVHRCDQPKLSQESTIHTDLWNTDQATADCKILFWNSSDSTCSTVRSDKPSWSSWKKKCLRQLSLHFLGPSKITIQFKRYPNLIL